MKFFGTDHDTFVVTDAGEVWLVGSVDGIDRPELHSALPPGAEELDSAVCCDLDLSEIPEPTVQEGDETYRRVAHCMGAWAWGWPRGQRTAIVCYVARYDAKGHLRWYSSREVCDGLTAANVDMYERAYPDAFTHPHGSLHRKLCG